MSSFERHFHIQEVVEALADPDTGQWTELPRRTVNQRWRARWGGGSVETFPCCRPHRHRLILSTAYTDKYRTFDRCDRVIINRHTMQATSSAVQLTRLPLEGGNHGSLVR